MSRLRTAEHHRGEFPAVAGTPSSGIFLEQLTKTYPPDLRAVEGISLAVPAGQFVAVIGPSGCGKSTLLRIIAGLEPATSGTVRTAAAGRVAYVFQDAHLLPWRSVRRNVELPLELAGVNKPRRHELAEPCIEAVGLADFADRFPAELSGGMRMRVSLARALVTEPDLLLMDEPFAAVDEITRQQLDDQLRTLWTNRRMTVLFVTHSIMEATYLAERAVVLSARPARVVLDRMIELPAERNHALRGTNAFAREMQTLFDALERGGAR